MILVTGATGYIGSHMVFKLMEEGHKVLMVDNLSNSGTDVASRLHNHAVAQGWPLPIFKKVDLTNTDAVRALFRQNEIYTVFHFAGLKSVPESLVRPLDYFHNNVTATLNILRHGQEVSNLIFSSSAAVYGMGLTFKEGDPVAPHTPYGQSKAMCEQVLQAHAVSNSGFRYAALRYFNPVGAHPSGTIGENPKQVNNLMPAIARVLMEEGRSLEVYGQDYPTHDGTCVRDFFHVCDLVDGHLSAWKYIQDESSLICNLGSGVGSSVMDVVDTYSKVSGLEVKVHPMPKRRSDPARMVADIGLARTLLDYTPKYTLTEMCETDWRWRTF